MAGDEGARYYFAVCPTAGVETRVKLGGGPGDDDVSALPPVLEAENGHGMNCLACGTQHALVEITKAANDYLDKKD